MSISASWHVGVYFWVDIKSDSMVKLKLARQAEIMLFISQQFCICYNKLLYKFHSRLIRVIHVITYVIFITINCSVLIPDKNFSWDDFWCFFAAFNMQPYMYLMGGTHHMDVYIMIHIMMIILSSV